MTRTLWALAVLLSHWRRNPVQIVSLVLGLALATALWSGVQAINQEARSSYARATGLLGGPDLISLRPAQGNQLDQSVFIDLRRTGYMVSPVVEGAIRVDGQRLRVLGIEPVSLPQAAMPDALAEDGEVTAGVPAFLKPPWQALAASETVEQLAENKTLPPRSMDASLPPGLLIMDIGVAQKTLQAEGSISRLIVNPGSTVPSDVLSGFGLEIVPPAERGATQGLTDSFHLNLTAFAFLAFSVGLLIVRASIGLALEQRLATIRTLRTVGLSAARLTMAVLIEVIALAVVSGTLGLVLGYTIAAALLPDVSGSLRGLYGVSVSGELTLAPIWILSGLGMALVGAIAAAGPALWSVYQLPPLATGRPESWRAAEARQSRFNLIAAGLCVGVGVILYGLGDSLEAGFATMGAVLLAGALALPSVISIVLSGVARTVRAPILEWLVADMRQQLPGLSLALVALLLALAANVGVSTMVGGFRETFLDWLDRRLAAEIYVRGRDETQALAIDAWAAEQPDVRAVLPGREVDRVIQGHPMEIRSAVDSPTYRRDWPLLKSSEGAWDRLFAGTGVMVSEQAAQRLRLAVGTQLDLGSGPISVVGVYPDYGNPRGQAMIALDRLERDFPQAPRLGTGLRLEPERIDQVLDRLVDRFDLPPDNVIEQVALKRLSRQTFEQTFAVTAALNILTLLVASLALFTAMLTLFDRRLAMLAPVWALGMSRTQLSLLEMGKTLLLAALTALVAIPVGLFLAWLLVSVVNVKAFGWRLPLIPYPGDWLWLGGVSLGAAATAAVWPVIRLARTAPSRFLRVFADAR